MVTKVVKVTFFFFFFVSESPLHDFCCAYLERQNMNYQKKNIYIESFGSWRQNSAFRRQVHCT